METKTPQLTWQCPECLGWSEDDDNDCPNPECPNQACCGQPLEDCQCLP